MEKVSIIIPTYNSSRTLENCLLSIQNQDYKNIEIIVVDNNSSDSTKDIANKYTDHVFNKWPERTAQKNHAIKKSAWEYLCFIDSDMIVWKHVISECLKELHKKDDNWWICIPERSIGEWVFVKIRDFERSFYEWSSIESARFFSKADVIKVWGFEEDLIFFEESLLPQKIESILNKQCKSRIKDFIEHDESDIKLWGWLKKKFYYGKSLETYKNKVKDIWIKQSVEWQIWIIGRYAIFFKNKRFYTKPFLAFWVLTLKTLEFWAWWLWYFIFKLK